MPSANRKEPSAGHKEPSAKHKEPSAGHREPSGWLTGPTVRRAELNHLVHDLRNRLNNIVLNGELAKLLLKQGNSESEVVCKIDKLLEDTKQTAVKIQQWSEKSEIK